MEKFVNKNVQGTQAWLENRKNFIGSSDAAVIMETSPWMTPYQLWEEKLGLRELVPSNSAMERGKAMEPVARKAFEKEVGYDVFPQVLYHPTQSFMMASLDGLSLDGEGAVEIKCPGAYTHAIAVGGEIPECYYPQLQHQLAVTGLPEMSYWSYDGENGVHLVVHRDDAYIEKLIAKEREFWECVTTKTPPPLTDRDYQQKDGNERWAYAGRRLREIDEIVKGLTAEKDILKAQLIADAEGISSRGEGVLLTKSMPKGSVDYTSIPELIGVDLDRYRKPSREVWTLRIEKQSNE